MWRPVDWILRGRYCPESELREELERFAIARNLNFLIVLVMDRFAFLRSLSQVVGVEAPASWERTLRRPDPDSRARERADSRAHEKLARQLPQIPRSRPIHDFPEFAESLERILGSTFPQKTHIIGVPNSQSELQVVLIAHRTKGSRKPLLTDHYERLLAMVSATPQAEARRDALVMDMAQSTLSQVGRLRQNSVPLDRRLAPNAAEGTLDSLERFSTSAAELAQKLAGAASAAIFLRDRLSVQRLRKIGSASGDYYSALSELPADPVQPYGQALERNRSIQFQNGEGFVELLTPIPWMSAQPESEAAGLIAISSATPNEFFTAYQVAVLRNVALRIAMYRSTVVSGTLSLSMSRMRRRERVNAPRRILANGLALPADVSDCLPRILPELEVLARETESHSVTLRMLMGSPEAGAPESSQPRLSLVRVACFPHSEDERRSPIQLPDGGVNWEVVSTGRLVHEPDVKKARRFTDHGRPTLSELCVPVRSEGRLIGVLNLESPYRASYDRVTPLVEAFAGAVSRTISDAAAPYSWHLVERAVEIDTVWHDLPKPLHEAQRLLAVRELDPLNVGRRKSDSSDDELAQLVSKALNLVDSVQSLNQPLPPRMSTLREVFVQLKERSIPTEGLEDKLDSVLLSPRNAPVVLSILESVVTNIVDHGAVDPPASVGLQNLVLDGQGFCQLWFENPMQYDGDIDSLKAADFYRVPVNGTRVDKPGVRLGAFLAGVRARSLGGAMFATVITRTTGNHFR